MKRKRGPKKGHKKGKKNDPVKANDPASTPVFINTEDTIYLDQNVDNSQNDSEMDAEPAPIEPDKTNNFSSIDSEHPNGKSIGRLKVKLKSSRALEPHRSYSDMQTPSDTDRSNRQAAMELNNRAVEMEDSAVSDGQLSEMQNNNFEIVPKKAGIRIKSLKAQDLSGEHVEDKICSRLDSSPHKQMELKQPNMDSRYNERELSASLTVIKKIMKMDAAEPFNTPVDPVALGIPDYFDYIDTPMDFGTICHDLENGGKYMNSEDVFKDVRFIWENCYKYNNKGDYVVDLMKRVKKNFMKYWMAAGLYLDQAINGGTEYVEDDITHSQDKYYKEKKHKHRKHGIDLHKSDCLCAVCVVRRRKKEKDRENNLTAIGIKMKMSNGNQLMGLKTESSSHINHNSSTDVTSSRDQSQEIDANADAEEVENEEKFEVPEQNNQHVKQEALNYDTEPFMLLSLDNGNHEDPNKHSQEQELDSFISESGELKDLEEIHQHDRDEERKHVESAKRALFLENPLLQENHSILPICKSLFPSKVKSVWQGPHSLMRRNISSIRDSPIHSALASFMK